MKRLTLLKQLWKTNSKKMEICSPWSHPQSVIHRYTEAQMNLQLFKGIFQHTNPLFWIYFEENTYVFSKRIMSERAIKEWKPGNQNIWILTHRSIKRMEACEIIRIKIMFEMKKLLLCLIPSPECTKCSNPIHWITSRDA